MLDSVQRIQAILDTHPGGAVHLMGIGGVGMAGLAGLLHQRGFQVSGCDLESNRLTKRLIADGVSVVQGHDPAHVDAAPFLLIRSTAVAESHPELARARERGIPVFRRGEVFPALLQSGFTVAVSGTHGKTTTTALTVHAVRGAGKDPSFFIGGEWEGDGRVFGAGADPLIIVEADESDGTLIHYQPDIAVITGIDYDHMEHFADEQAFIRVFEQFIARARRAVVYCRDDARLRALVSGVDRAVSYGFSSDAHVCARNVRDQGDGSTFTLAVEGKEVGEYTLPVAGLHNVLNALAALAVAHELNLSLPDAGSALHDFRPVRRRFERVGVWRGVSVYSDYAHHPTEIKALIGAARRFAPRRLLAIFQPHRYTRTRALGDAFPAAFEGVDHVILAPIYAASEKPVPGGTEEDLARTFREYGGVSHESASDLRNAWDRFAATAQEGDVLLLVGAGDIEKLGELANHAEI